MKDAIGWAASIILVVTIATQILKQWRDKTSAGVSTWLFVGQLAASVGFTIYSLLVQNWVFSVTNGIMILNGLLGYGITVRHKRHRGRDAQPANR
ncbi:MAG: PQ-loop domain-containing transporter [Acidobacteriota bacterium]|nr:PQ-loop domain-containing transporter [Acidobacteriota bacterium]